MTTPLPDDVPLDVSTVLDTMADRFAAQIAELTKEAVLKDLTLQGRVNQCAALRQENARLTAQNAEYEDTIANFHAPVEQQVPVHVEVVHGDPSEAAAAVKKRVRALSDAGVAAN